MVSEQSQLLPTILHLNRNDNNSGSKNNDNNNVYDDSIPVSSVSPREESAQSKMLTNRIMFLVALAAGAILASQLYSRNNSPSSPSSHHVEWDDETHAAWQQALRQAHGAKRRKKEAAEQVGLVYFNHSDAFAMLTSERSSKIDTFPDFFRYQEGWEAQISLAHCPVASAAAVLNSLRGQIELPQDSTYKPFRWATQHALLVDPCVREIVPSIGDDGPTFFMGMGLPMTKRMLECLLAKQQYQVTMHHVDPDTWTVHDVRHVVKKALNDPNARVLINYDRGGIGQGTMGHGHFSPIGAYNEMNDAFLIMDVAKYKYPPVWVPASTFYGGVATTDHCAEFNYPTSRPDPITNYTAFAIEIGCQENFRGILIVEPMTS